VESGRLSGGCIRRAFVLASSWSFNQAMRHPVIFVVLMPILLFGCVLFPSGPDPEFKLVNVRLTRLSLADATLEATVKVINEDKKPLRARNVQVGIYVSNQLVGVGTRKEELIVPGNSTLHVPLTVTATFQDLLRTVEIYREEEVKEVNYELKGRMEIEASVGMVNYDFTEEGKIPVPRLPKVQLNDIKFKRISIVRYWIRFIFELENPNTFDMKIEEFTYNLMLSKERVAKGRLTRQCDLPALGKAEFILPIETSVSKLARAARKALETGVVAYHLKGNVVFQSLLGRTDFAVDKEGNLDIGKYLQKNSSKSKPDKVLSSEKRG